MKEMELWDRLAEPTYACTRYIPGWCVEAFSRLETPRILVHPRSVQGVDWNGWWWLAGPLGGWRRVDRPEVVLDAPPPEVLAAVEAAARSPDYAGNVKSA